MPGLELCVHLSSIYEGAFGTSKLVNTTVVEFRSFVSLFLFKNSSNVILSFVCHNYVLFFGEYGYVEVVLKYW